MSWLIKFALCAILPDGPGLPGVASTKPYEFIRQLRQDASFQVLITIYLAAFVFHLSPLLTIGVPLPAFLLPKKIFYWHIFRMHSHRIYIIRQCMVLLKHLATICWGKDNKVRQQLGLPAYAPDPGTWRASSP